jgi:GrpB-like predicted nucleotidyltransferase (UPF0157 family)
MTGAIKVELHAHSPDWAAMALQESELLRKTLGSIFIAVHHIGSTSVPGIVAKPIVDLIPVVTDLDSLDRQTLNLEEIGYEYLREFGLPGRRYCRRNDPISGKRMYQLHCYATGSPEIVRHLAFADYLRTHPAIAKEYEAEKIRAAALHPNDSHSYGDAKGGWIKRVEQDALEWWKLLE